MRFHRILSISVRSYILPPETESSPERLYYRAAPLDPFAPRSRPKGRSNRCGAAVEVWGEPACKPDSVPGIKPGGGHPSGTHITARLLRPTRASNAAGHGIDSYLALLREGFTKPARHRDCWWALTPPFHPCPTPLSRHRAVSLSVALSVGSPRLGVTQHPALWSPDFPQAPEQPGARDHPADSPYVIITIPPFP